MLLKTSNKNLKILNLTLAFWVLNFGVCYAQEEKQPNVSGTFYPDNPKELSQRIDFFLDSVKPEEQKGEIFAIISPHAGYEYSGQVAAYAYKLIKGKPYKTVVVIGPSHQYGFSGVSVYPKGSFRTPLGSLTIDNDFAQKLLYKDKDIYFEPRAFAREHSIEVQLPFLQKVLSDFKIVPIIMGDCSLSICKKLSALLKDAIANRKDVLVVASSDMYHGLDYQEAELMDNLTLSYIKKMDAEGLYSGLRDGRLQLCGGFPVVSSIILAKDLGHNNITVLKYTNSAEVTARKTKGIWTVGYASSVIDQEKGETQMLNKDQRKRLLGIARSSIETYLKTAKKLELTEKDSILMKEMGAFVTLKENGELRGCIGNMVGTQPLYLTVRDMAVEAAVGDPRFLAVELTQLPKIKIEISVLSPLQKIDSPDEIKMGVHGVLIKRGFRSGVFLPQVATETGWSKEEFLSNLCLQKAGIPSGAWQDKATEIYVFTAEIFSEEEM